MAAPLTGPPSGPSSGPSSGPPSGGELAEWPVVACTGHRDVGDATDWLTDTLRCVAGRLHDRFATRVAISGFARETDLKWAAAAVDAGMRLWACIPHDGQADKFSRADRDEWIRLRALAEHVFVAGAVPDDTPPKKRSSVVNGLLWKRNTAMVKAATALVAVWDGRLSGGTHGTLVQAAKLDRPGVWINPAARSVTGRLPTLPELEPFAVYHRRCGHVRLVALRADADRELARLHAASYPAWKIRRAKPREDDSFACTACYIHPGHLETADRDLAATQPALL